MGDKTFFYIEFSYTGMHCIILEAQDLEQHGRVYERVCCIQVWL